MPRWLADGDPAAHLDGCLEAACGWLDMVSGSSGTSAADVALIWRGRARRPFSHHHMAPTMTEAAPERTPTVLTPVTASNPAKAARHRSRFLTGPTATVAGAVSIAVSIAASRGASGRTVAFFTGRRVSPPIHSCHPTRSCHPTLGWRQLGILTRRAQATRGVASPCMRRRRSLHRQRPRRALPAVARALEVTSRGLPRDQADGVGRSGKSGTWASQ